MILTDSQILYEMRKRTIIVSPFNKRNLGSNSYDVHLGAWLRDRNALQGPESDLPSDV